MQWRRHPLRLQVWDRDQRHRLLYRPHACSSRWPCPRWADGKQSACRWRDDLRWLGDDPLGWERTCSLLLCVQAFVKLINVVSQRRQWVRLQDRFRGCCHQSLQEDLANDIERIRRELTVTSNEVM